MEKSDLIYMIMDNALVYGINLPGDFNLQQHLEKFNDDIIKMVAGFNQKFLEHFLIISKGKDQKELEEPLKKMEKISYMIGPLGNLNYLRDDQLEHILTKMGPLKLDDITEQNIMKIADEHLEAQFGGGGYSQGQALEGQLASAAFYLQGLGYSNVEIEAKLDEVRKNPSQLDALFNLPEKETMSISMDLEPGGAPSGTRARRESPVELEQSVDAEKAMENYIESIKQDISKERADKVAEIMAEIKESVKDLMNESYEKVFALIHPDRLKRAARMLKSTKRKSKRPKLIIEWYFCSHLLENISFKVEHWQVSAQSGHGQAGVYTAGINFSRYDPIVKEFNDNKLTKVVNIMRRILQTPSKKAIQKLGQDLVAETGFDEHLYFTD